MPSIRKRIVITGVSRGLGRAMATGFIARPHRVRLLLKLGPRHNGRPLTVPGAAEG